MIKIRGVNEDTVLLICILRCAYSDIWPLLIILSFVLLQTHLSAVPDKLRNFTENKFLCIKLYGHNIGGFIYER